MSTHVQGVQGGVGTTSVNKIVVWNTKPKRKSFWTKMPYLDLFSTCLSVCVFTIKIHNSVQYWINWAYFWWHYSTQNSTQTNSKEQLNVGITL